MLARFGAPRAAAGFALSLDHLAWALEAIGREEVNELRLLAVGATEALLANLRTLGVPCTVAHAAPGAEALAYARAWRFSHVLEVAPPVSSGSSVSSLARLARLARPPTWAGGRRTIPIRLLEPQALASH